MKNKVRRNLKKNNKFNWRKHRGKKALKEFLKNCNHIDIEIEDLGMPISEPITVPIGEPFLQLPSNNIEISLNPLNIQIKNGDKWENVVPVYIEGIKENK